MNESAAGERRANISFTGTTSEYFKIWIINLALTIVTLGMYSAWAKVRKLRYFYGNTHLEDGTFEYHASPVSILIGRVIAFVTMMTYYFTIQYAPMASAVIFLAVFLLMPVLLVRSRVFQMRNTSYHGLRFNFQRDYGRSFATIYGSALITVLSLGLASPSAIYMRNKFVANSTGFGKTLFKFGGGQGEFYAIFWKSAGLAMLGLMIFGGFIAVFTGAASSDPWWIPVLVFAFSAAISIYFRVRQRNYVWNTTTLGSNRFVSFLSVTDMVVIYLTNIFAIILTLGLAIPWAQIRLAKYRAEHLQVLLVDDWRDYIASKDSQGNALGEEVGEAFDAEIDIGF
ncbi:MAG: YjgN family protein [Woeseiaceae bacterium]|nr:YjgN family protein [Woeseiaceae bacterium]